MIRVLIVDDKQENLYLLRVLLQGHGCSVGEAHNGAEALTRARQAPPDLIISDLLMPVMDGYTLLREWKADERLRKVPFVVYTATYTEPKDERLALDLGADAFIIKPVEPEPFMARIQEVLAKKVRGEIHPAGTTEGHEVGLLKEYSEVLVNKLEKKVFQLEQANQALKEEIGRRQQAEAELLESRQAWENIFQATGHPTIIMDLEHGIVAANKKCIAVTGKSHDELLNAKCYEVFHANGKRPQGCPMEALLQSGSTESVEMEMEALGGYYLVTCTPVLDQEGNIRKVIHVATDITERKKSEESQRQSEETHRSLIEHLPQRIFLKDRNSVYLSCNTNYAADLGILPEQIVGKDDFAFHPSELAQLYRADDQACMATGTVKDLEEPYQSCGQERWAHTIKVPYRDRQGQVIGVLGIFEDITERKKSEEALRESETRYRALFSQSMDGIYVTTCDGMLLEANQAFLDILGYKRDDIVGGDIRTVYVNPSDPDRFVRTMEASGSVKDYPLSFKRKDEKEVECLLTSNVRRAGDGTIIGYQGILRDITEHKYLQKQLFQAQKMEAIGTLAGGVAHDFNNLLQVVLGYSELMLADEDLSDRLRVDLGKVLLAARSGADLVQRLLTFSRKTETNPLDLDLNQRIRQTHKFLERTIPKMIDIELILAEDLSRIHADPTQLDQVLMNLSVNARDAMPEGGRLIIETANVFIDEDYAASHLETKLGMYVQLSVSDTGSGMDRETLEHIFEPFFTTKAPGKGTGLGLAMVFGIVKQHHGFVECYSEVGRGTTFKIYLPAISAEPEEVAAILEEMSPSGTETVLLVDDEDMVRELGQRILTRSGYTVLTATNGEEALQVYWDHKEQISIIILDLIMPTMSGKDCLKELLKTDPQTRVLIASGYSAGASTNEFVDLGAKGFVAKPFRFKELLRLVRRTLDEG
jgi:two-component system, cell cycle sensor histidine kinase and response regulator CckA